MSIKVVAGILGEAQPSNGGKGVRMSKTWWGIVAACFTGAIVLIGAGFLLFGDRGFLENLFAEAIGVLVGLGVIVWLVEGRVLTTQKRVRETLEYRRTVFQTVWDSTQLFAREVALIIAGDFDPPADLYGHESGSWEEAEPLLRNLFRRAMDVPHEGMPKYVSLTEETAQGYFTTAADVEARIRESVAQRPEFSRTDVLGPLDMNLTLLAGHVEHVERLALLSDPGSRYSAVGYLGEILLDIANGIDSPPSRTELW
ncbi:MAG: hypothetical protein OXS47_08250 [Chloroflexota bacterium]|nr:hypothetical protein [Chloroflexota bacterium]